jgi:hypothetical protein
VQVTLDGQHYSVRAEATAVFRQIRTVLPLADLMDPVFDGADQIESYSGPTFDFDGVRQVSFRFKDCLFSAKDSAYFFTLCLSWQAFTFGSNVWNNLALSETQSTGIADIQSDAAIATESSCSEGGCSLSGPASCDGCISLPEVTAHFAGLDVAGFALGRTHGLAVASETFGTSLGTQPIAGRLYAFGDNSHGQLGTGDLVPAKTPKILRTCCQRAVDTDGRKYCLKWMDQVAPSFPTSRHTYSGEDH